MKKKQTPPPSFPLQLDKNKCGGVKKEVEEQIQNHISRLTTPIFNKFLKKLPQEHHLNQTMVGSQPSKPTITFLWQPHNHRLYFDFSKENFNPKKPSNHTLQKYKSMVAIFNTAYNYTSLNYDSEHKYEKFMFCTIRVKKTQVEVINNYHHKQWRKITAESVNEIDLRIDEVMNSLKEHSINALKTFIELHGGSSNFTILNERCEQGIHGDDYLDKIPKELIINDTYVKKLYKEKTEFKTTTAIKNYVSNRAIEKIAPEIALEINKLNQKQEIFDSSIDTYNTSVNALTEQMSLHLNVMNNINGGITNMNNSIKALKDAIKPQKKKKDVINDLFKNPAKLKEFKGLSKEEKNKILFGEEIWLRKQ